jgi:hypothetical protein
LKRKGYSGMSPLFSHPSLFHPLFPLTLCTPLSANSLLTHLPSTQLPTANGDSSTHLLRSKVDGRWSMVTNDPGEGFNSSGTPLSGLKKDEYHGKLTGLAAAEKRLAVQKKIGKGGVLGGNSVLGRSMKDVLAEVCLHLYVFSLSMSLRPLGITSSADHYT